MAFHLSYHLWHRDPWSVGPVFSFLFLFCAKSNVILRLISGWIISDHFVYSQHGGFICKPASSVLTKKWHRSSAQQLCMEFYQAISKMDLLVHKACYYKFRGNFFYWKMKAWKGFPKCCRPAQFRIWWLYAQWDEREVHSNPLPLKATVRTPLKIKTEREGKRIIFLSTHLMKALSSSLVLVVSFHIYIPILPFDFS